MHYIYILKCNDGSLYTGYTIDLTKRLLAHNKGIASKYTRGRLPAVIIYHEVYETKSEALKREYRIKQFSREEKLKLIKDNF